VAKCLTISLAASTSSIGIAVIGLPVAVVPSRNFRRPRIVACSVERAFCLAVKRSQAFLSPWRHAS
jgi:hypothetical protein